MACFKPITAWKPLDGGELQFSEKKNCREIKVPCGWCVGCRLKKQNDWAVRAYCESKLRPENCFLTLTYGPEHRPMHGSLFYPHVQGMFKALRNRGMKFRYLVAGEYGEALSHPHYHVLMFGADFADKRKSNSMYSVCDLYRSDLLEAVWPYGHSSIGNVTMESARYVAGYCMKKIVGDLAETHYQKVDDLTGEIVSVEPEFSRMSLKPGLGYEWMRRYWRDVYLTEHDSVIVGGLRKSVPRYFKAAMDSFADVAPTFMDAVDLRAYERAMSRADDNTPERLAVREQVTRANLKFFAER